MNNIQWMTPSFTKVHNKDMNRACEPAEAK